MQSVVDRPLTVVVGASGSGKSSVVRAGLLPALRRHTESRWEAADPIRPGKSPLDALRATRLPLDAPEGSESRPLSERVRKWVDANPEAKLVLVVDQFEELVTQCADAAQRRSFVAELERMRTG
jgi:hypothetical protein